MTLRDWGSFYVIVGSASAALIGLQFVAMALIADLPRQTSRPGIDAFSTPTTLHFSVCLFIAAALSAPWQSLRALEVLLAAIGGGGFVYSLIIAGRASTQSVYDPVLEDWIFHVVLPALVYATLAVGAALLGGHGVWGLTAIGAATLVLVFVAIHNAWDNVTYLVVLPARDQPADGHPPDRR
jgi:hypothetical protein